MTEKEKIETQVRRIVKRIKRERTYIIEYDTKDGEIKYYRTTTTEKGRALKKFKKETIHQKIYSITIKK